MTYLLMRLESGNRSLFHPGRNQHKHTAIDKLALNDSHWLLDKYVQWIIVKLRLMPVVSIDCWLADVRLWL
jgi:hypothetical protein